MTDGDQKAKTTRKINRLITEMTACDVRPIAVLEDECFERLLKFLATHYKMKNRSYTEIILNELCKGMHCRVQSETVSARSSIDKKHSLFSVAVHFLDGQFKPNSAISAPRLPKKCMAPTRIVVVAAERNTNEDGICLFL